MNSSLTPRLIPIFTVLAALAWLCFKGIELILHPERDYLAEILGLFLAVVGLSHFGEAKEDLIKFFKSVVIQITDTGEVKCIEVWKHCLGIKVSKSARATLSRLIRDGQTQWVVVEDEKIQGALKALQDAGVNTERGDAPGSAQNDKFKAGLAEFSSHCNFLKVSYLKDLSDRHKVSQRLLTSDEIAEVGLGLARQIYVSPNSKGWEADAISVNEFSPWGIHSKEKERPKFRVYFTDNSIGELEQRCEMDARSLHGARIEVYILPETAIVRDFLPSMLQWSEQFTKQVRRNGGITESIGEHYWNLLYWEFELRPRLDNAAIDAAHNGPSLFENPSLISKLEQSKAAKSNA